MEDVISTMGQTDGQRQLNLVVKADVQGSVEALRDSLTAIGTDQIKVNVIGSGVGGITESDATLAAASKAILIGFNVRADASARKVISDSDVDLRYFSIIYDVIDQVKQAATGLLGTEIREEIIGTRRCATCSARRSSAQLPAAWSSKAWSSATNRSACCATTP
jgi:Translation initiation factor 2 (IF-2; GTPase)